MLGLFASWLVLPSCGRWREASERLLVEGRGSCWDETHVTLSSTKNRMNKSNIVKGTKQKEDKNRTLLTQRRVTKHRHLS